MLTPVEKDLLEVIKLYAPSFHWGKMFDRHYAHSIVSNVVVGFAYSKSWWYRTFRRRALKREIAFLEMALYWWTTETKLDYEHISTCYEWYKWGAYAMHGRVAREVQYSGLNEARKGVFRHQYMWDVYVVLVKHGKVRDEVAKRYQTLRW